MRRTVTDRILMTDAMKIVAINALGLDNEGKFSFANTPGTLYEWLHDSYSPQATTLNDAGLTSDSTLTQFTVADGSIIQPGDILLLDDEKVWVSAVSANVITVTRDFDGTQATHANSIAVTVVGRARLEGADANDSHYTQPTSGYNYSQILQKTIKVSRTDNRIPRYGIADVVNREIDKAMDEQMQILAKLPYYGVRAAGSASTPRSAGGIATFVTTNVTAMSSAALTPKVLEDAIQQCWDGYGNPQLLFTGAWGKRKITDFYSAYVRTTIDENRGGIVIDRIVSPLGIELSVIVDRNCPSGNAYLVDPDLCGFITFDDFFYEELGKTGDTAPGGYGEVVGEYGLVVAKPNAHAIISGFSTSL
jgi:hypothetical protein